MMRKRLAAMAAIAALALPNARAGQVLNLTNTSATDLHTLDSGHTYGVASTSGTIGDGLFYQSHYQPAGSGFLDSFERVHQEASGNTEQGFNTDQAGVLNNVDNSGGENFTHSLLLSSVPTATINGTSYYAFLLDINQANGGSQNYLSLNSLKLYTSDVGSPNYSVDGSGSFTGLTSGNATLAWDMNGINGQPSTYSSVVLDYNLNSGSGQADMYFYVPKADFNNQKYLVLYSQFGNPPGGFATTDGYEEWATVANSSQNPVPEPATFGTAASAVVLIAGYAWVSRRRRRSQTVTS